MSVVPVLTKTPRSMVRPVKRVPPPPHQPPFETGDHLSRAEFERRYTAYPEIKKAELIEGVVYIMSSPIRYQQHSRPHGMTVTWLGTYEVATPGVLSGIEPTVRLDSENEVQPDALLRLDPRLGGRSRVAEDGYLEGPPELIVEIAASSAAYDLFEKRRVYQRCGVLEYLVLQVYEQRVDWFHLREGVYEALQPDADGLWRSELFPGLLLQPEAIWADDLAGLLAVLQTGLATPEHAEFVARLQAAREVDTRISESG